MAKKHDPSRGPEEPRVWPEQVIGGKYVRLLSKHLDQLRQQTEHGNRQLFLDDGFVVYLLAYFNGSSALLVVCLRTIPEMDIPFPKFNGVLNDPPVSPLGGP
jgi:hypothetical protein